MRRNGRIVQMSAIFVVFASLICVWSCYAEETHIVTWNVKDLFSVDGVKSREDDLKNTAQNIKPDILCIQEVTSLRVVQEISKTMGLTGYHIACSDFVQSDSPNRSAFEVAIISKYPRDQVIEYDPSPDNQEEDPDELLLAPVLKIGIKEISTSRGFLWARIDKLKLTITVVHLKSSLGRVGWSDRRNAEKREFVAAAVAASVREDKGFFPGYSFVVAGDFNVGHSDNSKNGNVMEDDCYADCGDRDRYDETHTLLSGGLVGGLKMRNLTLSIEESTYPSHPGSPIDNIYIDGAFVNQFSNAAKSSDTFGSDHVPVWTLLTRP